MKPLSANGKRIVLWTVLTVVVAAGLSVAFLPRAVKVDLMTVARSSMLVTVAEEGETRIHDVFVMSAPVAGRLQRIDIHVGDTVVADETILAMIEPGDPILLDPRSEAQARAAVQAGESALAVARAEVEQADAELEFARAEHVRALELIADNSISRRALDDAERAYKTRKAALATVRATLQMRLFELEQAKAQLLSPLDTQASHEDCECIPITAPVGGRVLRVINSSERIVSAGESLIEIGDPAGLEIVVDFLSADAVQIDAGQRVIIEGWGGDRPLAGRVQRVEPFGFTKISALGIEEQRVNVVIDFVSAAEQWRRLGHGYQVEARVVLWEQEEVLTVPLTALFRNEERWSVFVDNDGRAELRDVQLGRRNGLVAEIASGLEAGDKIVLHPSDRVIDRVRIASRG